MRLLALSSIILASVGSGDAACGRVSVSDDNKTQSVEPCVENGTSNANVTLLPGIVKLNLTGSVFLGNLNCSNNADLTTITAPNLTSIGELVLRNLTHLETIDMPGLSSASDVTLDAVGNTTTPSFVVEVLQSLGLTNSSVENFAAWPQEVKDLEITGNTQLNTISFPMLRKLGGDLRIDGNSQLNDMARSFPLLQEVGGAVQVSGNISSIAFPKLKTIKGGLEVNGSTGLDCSKLLSALKNQGINAQMARCNSDPRNLSSSPSASSSPSTSSSATGSNQTPSATVVSGSSPSSGQGLSTSAKTGIGVGIGLGVPIVAGLLIFLLWRSKRRAREERGKTPGWEKSELGGERPQAGAEPYNGVIHETEPIEPPLHIENTPLTVLSGCQVRRSGSKFREHGLQPDGREEEPS